MDKSTLPPMMKKAWDIILPGGYQGRKKKKKSATTMDNTRSLKSNVSKRKRILDQLK